MKISELIEKLTILQTEYGDLPVYFDDEEYGEQEAGDIIHRPERPEPEIRDTLGEYGLPERILIQDAYAPFSGVVPDIDIISRI